MSDNVIALPVPRKPASELELMLLGAVLDSDDPQALIDASGFSSAICDDSRVKLCVDLALRLAARKRQCNASTVFSAGLAVKLLGESDNGWLQGLQANNVLNAERFKQVAGDLRQMWLGRTVRDQLLQQAQRIDQVGLKAGDVAGFLSSLGHQLTINGYADDMDASGDVLELESEWRNPSPTGKKLIVPTGIKALDDLFGGFVPSANLILGDPQIGKSALMGSILHAQLKAGLKPGFFGLEEGHRWLTRRLAAAALKLKIAEVGVKQLTQEESATYDAFNETTFELFKNLQVFPFSGVSIDTLLLRCSKWIAAGVGPIYIDHIGEIRHKGTDNWAVADSYRRLRDLARRTQTPIVLLAHRSTAVRRQAGPPAPPRPEDVGLTGEAEKMVRLMLGLWRKHGELRVTVIKNNEGPSHQNSANTSTVQLESITTAGLVDPEGGAVVNLSEERRHEREDFKKKKREEANEAVVYRRDFSAQLAAKTKAAKEKAEKEKTEAEAKANPPQASMFEVKL